MISGSVFVHPHHGELGVYIIQPHPVHELTHYASRSGKRHGSSGAGCAMDLSSVATLSSEEQQEAIENHVAKESRRAVDQAMAAAEEHANATLAQEEAERNENTQARGKEPRSSDNSYTTNLGQVVAKAFQGFQEQAGSTNQAGAFRVSSCLLYTSPSPRDQRGARMPSSA